MVSRLQFAKNLYYRHREQFNEMVIRAMECDYSWDASAKKYEELYASLTPGEKPKAKKKASEKK